MKSQKITRHWTELSAYIDGQLPANKAARLEKRLSSDSALRVEYQDLLRTRKMLRSLPKRRVPRNFTLTPDMVRAPRRRIFSFLVPTLRLSSSAAALMLALTFAFEFMGGAPLMAKMTQDAAPAPAMEMMMEAAPAEAAEEPMILLWGEQNAPGSRRWNRARSIRPGRQPAGRGSPCRCRTGIGNHGHGGSRSSCRGPANGRSPHAFCRRRSGTRPAAG